MRRLCDIVLAMVLLGCGPESTAAAPPGKTAAGAPQAAAAPKGWPFDQSSAHERVAERLAAMAKDPSPQKWNWVPPGKKERYGHAELLVPAPPADVLGRVVDFAHYKEFAGGSTRLSTVRVVDKDPSGTSMYFRIPIMKGAIEIWYIVKFAPTVTVEDGSSVVDGHMTRGNVDGVHIAFTVRSGPDNKTWLSCDLGMDLKVPAPQEALDEELRDAAGDVIRALARAPGAAP
jgi:hypothetical protein